jgi:hypothetical protein
MLTPASPSDLPPLGELVADVPFWSYLSAALAGEGIARLRVWLTAGPEPGHLAVVTRTGSAAPVTELVRPIWAGLARRYGPSLVLLEHSPAPELGEGMETLDLVRIGADGSPHWTRIWPTPEDNPRHAGLELWMATYGHRSSAGWRASSTGVRARMADRRLAGCSARRASQRMPYQLRDHGGRNRRGDRHKPDQAKPECARVAVQRVADGLPSPIVVTRFPRRGHVHKRDLPSCRGLEAPAAPPVSGQGPVCKEELGLHRPRVPLTGSGLVSGQGRLEVRPSTEYGNSMADMLCSLSRSL